MDIFIDSNILVYSYDVDAGEKHKIANHLIQQIWKSEDMPYLSIQVLQETHVNMVKKGASVEHSAKLVSRYLAWNLVENNERVFERALKNQWRWQLSFWDAAIIAAAQSAHVRVLWSEDLNEGQEFDGLIVLNPLHSN